MVYEFGECLFDVDSRELFRNGEAVALEPRTLELLLYLIQQRERAVSKDELQENVWGTVVTDAALARAVMKLRKALGDSSKEPHMVRTIPRHGYRFVAALSATDGKAAGEIASIEAKRRPAIAVLPLVNMSGNPENEFFSDGIAEEIINLLARIPHLRVASQTSSFSFKGKQADIRKIAAELGVDYVLEGSVRRSADRVRITTQLIDARADAHLWSEIFDRVLTDIFAVQAEIASRVVAALNLTKTGRIEPYAAAASISAYDYYLRGRYYFHQWDRGAIDFSREMFEKAIEIDPDYARAWAGLADTLTCTVMWQDESDTHLRRAREASVRALALDPELSESHCARGFILSLDREYEKAAAEFEEAIRLNPTVYESWYLYGRCRFAEGKMMEAARLFGEAARLRIEDYQAACLRTLALERAGEIESALATAREAVQRARGHLDLHPEDTRAWTLGGCALVFMGEREEGLRWAARALTISPDDIGVLHNAACAYSRAGEVETALDLFEKRFKLGKAHKDWIDNDPDFDSVRDHPRFQAMLRT